MPWNLSILWSPLKIWTPTKFTIANFGHPVSKSWLRPWSRTSSILLSLCSEVLLVQQSFFIYFFVFVFRFSLCSIMYPSIAYFSNSFCVKSDEKRNSKKKKKKNLIRILCVGSFLPFLFLSSLQPFFLPYLLQHPLPCHRGILSMKSTRPYPYPPSQRTFSHRYANPPP